MKTKRNPDKAAYWRPIILRWKASGLLQSVFCEQEHLSANTFSKWKIVLFGKEKTSGGAKPKAPATFLPVVAAIDFKETKMQLPAATLFSQSEALKVAAEISSRDGSNSLKIFDVASPATIAAIIGACFK